MDADSINRCHIRVPIGFKPKYVSVATFKRTDSSPTVRTNTSGPATTRSANETAMFRSASGVGEQRLSHRRQLVEGARVAQPLDRHLQGKPGRVDKQPLHAIGVRVQVVERAPEDLDEGRAWCERLDVDAARRVATRLQDV